MTLPGSVGLVQTEIARLYGVPVVVAINRFKYDSLGEIELLQKLSEQTGAYAAVPSNHWAKGGEGAIEIAAREGDAEGDGCDPETAAQAVLPGVRNAHRDRDG